MIMRYRSNFGQLQHSILLCPSHRVYFLHNIRKSSLHSLTPFLLYRWLPVRSLSSPRLFAFRYVHFHDIIHLYPVCIEHISRFIFGFTRVISPSPSMFTCNLCLNLLIPVTSYGNFYYRLVSELFLLLPRPKLIPFGLPSLMRRSSRLLSMVRFVSSTSSVTSTTLPVL